MPHISHGNYSNIIAITVSTIIAIYVCFVVIPISISISKCASLFWTLCIHIKIWLKINGDKLKIYKKSNREINSLTLNISGF